MELLHSINPLKYGWTFDSIVNPNLIGSIREPLLLKTQSGMEMIPSSLMYKKSDLGNRTSPHFVGTFRKDVNEYAKGALSEGQNPEDNFIIFDEESGLQVIGLPLTGDSLIFSSLLAFKELSNTDSAEGILIRSLSCHFPQVQFGIYGSWALGMNTKGSDLDLLIHDGKDFEEVFQALHKSEAQVELNITPLDEIQLHKYAQQYSDQFNIIFGAS